MKNYIVINTGYVWTEDEVMTECKYFYSDAGYESPEKYFEAMVEKGELVETEASILIHGMPLDDETMSTIAFYMDDEIREDLHSKLAVEEPTVKDHEAFINAYLEKDPEFLGLLENEFNFERI